MKYYDIDEVISFRLKKLMDNNITIEEYLFLFMLYKGEKFKLSKYIETTGVDDVAIVNSLLELQYLTLHKSTEKYDEDTSVNYLKITKLGKELLSGENAGEKLEDWFDEWYDLWPSGVKSGGYYLRSDKKGAFRKMKDFLVENPQYGKDIIIKATRNYINDQSIQRFTHTKLSHYFIEKDGISILAGECENVDDNRSIAFKDFSGDEL